MKIDKIIENIDQYLFYSDAYCLICKEEKSQTSICKDCLSQLEFVDGKFNLQNSTCYYPLFYNNFIKKIIRKFKFNNKTYYVHVLAELLYDFIIKTPALHGLDYISYIPMTPIDQFNRGYNQAELLSRQLSYRLGIPCIQVIKKVKKTKEQNKISLKGRSDNLLGAYDIINDYNLDNKKLLLVDDIVTSGKTMDTAIETIKRRYEVEVLGLAITSSRIGEEDD